MPSRWAVAKRWSGGIRVDGKDYYPVSDLGEPACFACSYYEQSWDEPVAEKSRWNQSGLQRAHVVADSAGGSASADNLALLCVRCHHDAPMTKSPDIFWTWVARRHSHETLSRYDFERELEVHGLSWGDMEWIADAVGDDVSGAMRCSAADLDAGTGNGGMSTSTAVAIMVHAALKGGKARVQQRPPEPARHDDRT